MTSSPEPPRKQHEPEGPGRDAIDTLYGFVAAVELAPTVAIHSVGRDGLVRFWNRRCAELFGVGVAEAVGQPLDSLVRRADGEAFAGMLESVWQGADPHSRDWLVSLRDGSTRWVYSTHFPVVRDGEPRQLFCMEIDVTDRVAAERNLMMTAQVFDHCRDAIVVLDRRYRVISVNRAFSGLMGYSAAEVVGQDAPGLRSGVHDDAFYGEVWDYVARHGHWEGEIWTRRRNGTEFPCWVALTAIRGGDAEVADYMAILSDITDRKREEEHNRHLAEHDFLTDLPNRVLLLDRLRQALAAARRQHTRVAVMFIDLDRFKAVNDGFGHQAGDHVLKETAARLTRCVRGVDTVSRQGGDEFVVILADIGGVDQAAHVAKTVMQSIVQPIAFGASELTVSVSIGISIYPGDGADIDTLMQHADVAMYHAKQDGRDAFRFFSPEMNAHVVQRVQMENNLRQALANGEFVIEYQPEVSIDTGLVVGVEALLRWRHPERGLLGPADFLPVAEGSGLIVPIGEWVLQQACAQARRWRDAGRPVTVAVNLSSGQFLHNNLLARVDQALEKAGLDARYLDLEITEDVIMGADDATLCTVAALGQRGVQLTIDDFGTGCSNLSFLRRVPLSKLKIDRTLVGEIRRDPREAGIIPAIIAVARGLKLRVIAEGVETEEQLHFLRQHGCDEYQGYYASGASTDPDLTRRHR